jgi:hypothetical protein
MTVTTGNYLRENIMSDKQAQELQDTARLLRRDARSNGVNFLNTELDLSKTFAERAWALCAEGRLLEAKVLALVATEAYDTAKKFLTKLRMNTEQRANLAVKLGIVTPLIERLATIT